MPAGHSLFIDFPMRTLARSLALLAVSATPAFAQEAAKKADLLSASGGLMAWTLFIFAGVLFVLGRFAFGPITAAVEAREKALEEAIQSAKRDREEAARLLAEHRANLDASRAEGQKLIAEARVAAERVRAELVTQAQKEQADMLARARAEIQAEKNKAVAELRREAVELAIRGASKVIEKNLDQPTNRQLVESFLASVSPSAVTASR